MKKALQKREIKRMNESVTFLGFGALEIGRDWGLGDQLKRQRPDEEMAGQVLHAVLDKGINLIDTARAYHRSEERIGKYISSRRNEYILASKCGEHSKEPHTFCDFSYKAVKKSIDQSLQLLKTDVIDIMQIHFGPEPEKVIAEGETLSAMKDAQKEGKIRFLGASIDGDLAKQCIESGNFDVMQMEYNLLNRSNEENIHLCKKGGIGVFIRSGLAMGKLTSRIHPYLKEDTSDNKMIKALVDLVKGDGNLLTAIALQFLYQNDGIHSVLVGTKNLDRIEQNIQLLEYEIDPMLFQQVNEIVGFNPVK